MGRAWRAAGRGAEESGARSDSAQRHRAARLLLLSVPPTVVSSEASPLGARSSRCVSTALSLCFFLCANLSF